MMSRFQKWAQAEPVGKWNETMPKQKTHKGMAKRFKLTAKGKAKHRSAYRGHLLSHKTGKKKRGLRQDGVIEGTVAKSIADALRPGA